MRIHQLSILAAAALLGAACQSRHLSVVGQAFIFDTAEVDFSQCHASTIQDLGDGQFLAAWFAGTHEGHQDVAIWMSKYTGQQWSNPRKPIPEIPSDNGRLPLWNPVLFQRTASDTLTLFYKQGPNPREWKGLYASSTDRGETWSKGQSLADGVLGPIKNKPLVLDNGTILSPSSTESLDEVWKAHAEVSEDNGKTWTIYPISPKDTIEVIQPSFVRHEDGTIQALCRSKENFVMAAFSKDQGKTWSHWQRTNLQNPNSATDAIRLDNGQFLIVYNPDVAGKDWWEGRTKLRVALSKDGLSWKDAIQLEDGNTNDEYSYPTVIQDQTGKIHITYTWNRKNIKHVVLK